MDKSQMQNSSELSGKIEALLFVHGEPMKTSRLAELLSVSLEDVSSALTALSEELNSSNNRGLALINSDEKVMLVTKPEFGEIVKTLTNDELDSELTPAVLETLSLIAYLAPISRAEIEFIRGVNSSFILRNLLVRGLIAKEADKSKSGGIIYRPTFDFLRHVGITSPEELPEFTKYREVIRNISSQEEQK